jgi:hypothetical protein
MADLTQLYLAYIATLRAAAPSSDSNTVLATDLPVVRAAHPDPVDLDDYNTLMLIHLGV